MLITPCLRRVATLSAIAAIALVFSFYNSPPAVLAQGLSNAFGGFAASPDQPIDIQAKRLDVDDNAKRAVFTGEVIAKQDTFVMNSDTLEIRYASRSGAKKTAQTSGFGGGSTEVTLLTARGSVFIQSAKENAQTATGDWAEFDVKTRVMTMGDVVTLKQGKNVIRGTRLVINLNTGRSSVQSGTGNSAAASQTGGRIRMVITPDKSLQSGFGGAPKRKTRKRKSGSASQPVRSSRGNQ